MDNVETVGRN